MHIPTIPRIFYRPWPIAVVSKPAEEVDANEEEEEKEEEEEEDGANNLPLLLN